MDNTRDIGIFRITGESSTASGVRRIEAVTGEAALKWMKDRDAANAAKLKLEADKDLLKKIAQKRLEEETSKVGLFLSRAETFGSSKIVVENINDIMIETLRLLADNIRAKATSSIVILHTKFGDKVSFVASVTEDLVKRGISANSIAKDISKAIEGSGGGKNNFAQGGGRSDEKLKAALDKAIGSVKETLK